MTSSSHGSSGTVLLGRGVAVLFETEGSTPEHRTYEYVECVHSS